MSETGDYQLPQPGKPHELLEPFEGTFRTIVKIHTGQGEPIQSTGTMESRFVLGGLYLAQEYEGDKFAEGIPPFAGKGFWGYNSQSGKYEGFWIDNMSPMMQFETGEVDSTGRTWEMFSEVDHPAAGKLNKRSIIRLIDNDQHELIAYLAPEGGQEFLNMEISYSRIPS